MQIIHGYLTRETLKMFTILLVAAACIYLVVDFFEKIDDFLESRVPMSEAVLFFLLRLPLIVAQVTPVGVLLAVLIVVGLMARNHELVALQSSGIGVYHLLRPIILGGLAFTLLLFFFAEIVVPIAMAKANHIWSVKVNKQVATFKQKDIWIKGNRAIYHVAYFNPVDESISGLSFTFFDGRFNVARRIDAKRGVYKGGRWIVSDCVEQVRLGDGTYSVTYPSGCTVAADLVPEDLKKVVKKSEEMSLNELSAYIRRVKEEGYDATPYQVDWHAKLAFPAICVVMSILSAGIAFRRRHKEGVAVAVVYGIGLAFCYWVIYGVSLSLGYNGVLWPVAAAWTTNAIFTVVGVVILARVERI